MSKKDIYTMPGYLVRRTQQIATALFAEECGKLDLTAVQYAALVAIGDSVDVDATRLSALIAFDRATIGDVLIRLERKGWIKRESSPRDARVKLVRLSAEGAKILERVQPCVERVQKRLLEPLARKDRETMVRLLAQLVRVHDDVPMSLRAAE